MSKSKEYIVYVKEIHQTQIMVEASDESDALIKAMSGEGVWLDNTTEFIESLEPEYWECQEVKDA